MDFDTLGLPARIARNLTEAGITEPTPIQARAIPVAMNGRDVMGLAQTGTGKTAAFGLPIITALVREEGRPAPRHVRGLVLAPTRELAKQIQEALQTFAKGTALRIGLVVGGASLNAQVNRLERGTDILVATPGRLIDLMDRKAVNLSKAHFLVLDEADQMLDMGFIHALRQIAPKLPAERQTMLFSATMPKQMNELAQTFLTSPERIEVARPGKPAEKIDQCLHFVAQAAKTELLIEHLEAEPDGAALVFARTKHGAERLMKALVRAGQEAASIHGNKSQGQRDRAIAGFKSGAIRVLVATDVAARGIDIPDVRFVYNYDLPNVPDNYIHRIGRTARAGRDGTAIAYCAPEELSALKAIQKVMKADIPVAGPASWARPEDITGAPDKMPNGGRGGQKRGGGGGGGRGRGKPGGGKPGGTSSGPGKPKQAKGPEGPKPNRPRKPRVRGKGPGNRAA